MTYQKYYEVRRTYYGDTIEQLREMVTQYLTTKDDNRAEPITGE